MPPSPQQLLAKIQGGSSSLPLFSAPKTLPTIPSPAEIAYKTQQQNPTSPSFDENLLHAGASLYQGATKAVQGFGSDIKSFYTGNTGALQDIGAGKLNITPKDVLDGTEQVGDFIGKMAQGINEGILRIGKSVQQPLATVLPKVFVSNKENTGLTKAITGSDSTPTYQDIFAKAHAYAINNNATPDQAKVFSGLTVVGALFADNPVGMPEGAGARALFTLSEDGIKEIAQTSEESVIKEVLKKENPTLNEMQLEAIAPIYREATTPQEVKIATEQIAKMQHVPIRNEGGIPTPDEILAHAKQSEGESPYFRATSASDTPSVFHGTDADFKSFESKFLGSANGTAPINRTGFSFSSSPDVAHSFGDRVIEAKVDIKKPFVIDAKGENYSTFKETLNSALEKMDRTKYDGIIIRNYEDAGTKRAGGVSDHYIPFSESQIKAPSQKGDVNFVPVEGQPVKIIDGIDTFLHQPENGAYEVMEANTGRIVGSPGATPEEAIRSAHAALDGKSSTEIAAEIAKHPPSPRAVKATAPIEATTEKAVQGEFSPNLLHSIVKADTPGAIIDSLKGEFPAISDRALAPIAKRLSQLHRTGDIEGILKVVKNINEDIVEKRGVTALKPGALEKSIAVVGKHEAVGDLPASLGQLLNKTEAQGYLDAMSREIKSADEAVFAQQEYDSLFEHADQRTIDRFEELKTQRDIVQEILAEHPGRQLNGLYKGTFLSPREIQLDELINQRPNLSIDTKIDEILGNTGGDLEQAQAHLEAFMEMRSQLEMIKNELREIAPAAKATRILQNMMVDVPVIARVRAGDISSLADFNQVRQYRDITGFRGQSQDVYRNFERFFGNRYKDAKRVILDPFDKSKGAMIDEISALGDRIEENVIKKYGINRGSKESEAIQLFGEGKLSEEDLTSMVGRDKVKGVVESAAWFRKEYDKLLDEVNAVRAKIFPNDPTKLIPKRADYFRHFEEMSDGFRALLDIFETPAGIDPKLAGLSEWTKPKSKFLSFAQERIGKHSTVDAVGGFLDYAPTFAYAKHIDPHIGEFRYLRKSLAENAARPGVRELTPVADEVTGGTGATELVKQNGINHFLKYLDDFANDLAGKTNPMDRWLQDTIPGGRKTFQVINWVNRRVKANVILGNLSSAVSQFFNIPQGIASAKLYSLPGINRTLASVLTKNEPMEASSFIKERFKVDLASRFKTDWVSHPLRASEEHAKAFALWITQVGDEIGTKFIWNSHYEMANDLISKSPEGKFELNGVPYSDPVRFADDITRQMVSGRGIGEVPLIQKSKIFQLVAPFQLEVGNLWMVLSKFVKTKDFGAVAILLVTNYLMNRAAEQVRGSGVVFDPINAFADGASQAADEAKDGSYGRAAFKFVGRQVGEILSNLPVGQTIAAGIPDSWVQGLTQATTGAQIDKKELFGAADPGRYGSGLVSLTGLTNPLYRLLPPFGGGQAQRTIEGVESMLKGQVTDANGNVSFKTTPTVRNVVQAFLFGKNSTPEAQAFYDARNDLFNRQYSQDATRSATNIEAEKTWADIKALKTPQEKVKKLQALDTSDPDLADAVFNVAQSEAQGLTGTDRLIGMLGVNNGERAKYISDQVRKLSTPQERVTYLKALDDKKLIPDKVFDQIQALMAAPKDVPAVKDGSHSVSSILDTVTIYAEALGVDPVTAFNRIFTGQTIKRVDNGTIIVERMSLQASEAEAKAQGDAGASGVNGMNLDHTVPLELGGSNDKSNLKLVPEATWASYTPIENLLGEALRSKQITKQKAQDLITKFKDGELAADEVRAEVKQ